MIDILWPGAGFSLDSDGSSRPRCLICSSRSVPRASTTIRHPPPQHRNCSGSLVSFSHNLIGLSTQSDSVTCARTRSSFTDHPQRSGGIIFSRPPPIPSISSSLLFIAGVTLERVLTLLRSGDILSSTSHLAACCMRIVLSAGISALQFVGWPLIRTSRALLVLMYRTCENYSLKNKYFRPERNN